VSCPPLELTERGVVPAFGAVAHVALSAPAPEPYPPPHPTPPFTVCILVVLQLLPFACYSTGSAAFLPAAPATALVGVPK
jgi:hypothetical protein